MFRNKMKPDYQIILNSQDQFLLEKYGDKYSYSLDQRYKLSTLVDVYSGYYNPELKSNELASEYSQVLIAFCHFAGKWIPEGRFRFTPPQMISKNEILDDGKKYECISESITTLIHGDDKLARHADICKDVNLLEKYIKTSFEQEREIINKCVVPTKNTFDVSRYIPENKYQADKKTAYQN